MVTVTPLPQLDDLIAGVINVREQAIPVVNMRRHFRMPPAPPNLDPHILLVQMSHWTVGLIVDSVSEVTQLPTDSIEPPPPMISTVDSEYITGVGKVDGEKLIILLDLEKILTQEEKGIVADLSADAS